MGHMGAGGNLAHQKAIRILEESIQNNDAKLYVDISWLILQTTCQDIST